MSSDGRVGRPRVLRVFEWCIVLALWAAAVKSELPGHDTENVREILRLSKAAEMRAYIDSSVNPCDNFYKFACGQWARINPASIDMQTGIFQMLAEAYNRKVARLLVGPKVTSESDMDRKVKYFYESCLNRKEMRHNYKEKLLSIIEEFGGMPALKGEKWREEEFDWLEVVATILRKYGKQIIIGADVSADLMNSAVNRLYVGQLDDLVSGRAGEYYMSLEAGLEVNLRRVLGLSVELATETASEMVDFERKLARGLTEAREGLGMEDMTRLRLLEEMSENYAPTLNFTRFVEVWLGKPYRVPVYEYVEGYQRNLRKVIEETPKRVLANYIMWELLSDFSMVAERTHEKQLTKCVEATKRYFVKYLDNMVYRQMMKFRQHIELDVQQLWNELKRAFEQTLKSDDSNWMSEHTRDKALEKLSSMTMEINSYADEDFSKEFGDLVISTNNYFENVINILEMHGRNLRLRVQEPSKLEEADTLNFSPAYTPEYNKVLIPVAFMQPRYLWDDAYPAALKFGTVGYIIAHELAHGYDDTLRKYDAQGNLNNWWDRNSTEAYTARKECLRQQYGEYKYGGVPLEKTNSQGENIADNVGIRIAYAAYASWFRRHHSEQELQQELLPHLDYTPMQLFFISTAQVWCVDQHTFWKRLMAITDVHAPVEVRVNVMVSNSQEFGLAFQCQAGAKMHPHRKCVIY